MKKRESKRSDPTDRAWGAMGLEGTMGLPPPFQLVKLRELGDAFAHARSIAATAGAGTLVYVGRFDVVEFAAVLEPDEPLRLARRAFYAGLNALVEALSAHAPPERPLTVIWPDAIHVDGGLVGGGRLGWPLETREDDAPDWIVFGASIRTVCMDSALTALPRVAALEEQGFSSSLADSLLASFARFLMSNINAWRSVGFEAIERNYLHRLQSRKGATASIAANGDAARGAAPPVLARHR
jgi:hypothetical protein